MIILLSLWDGVIVNCIKIIPNMGIFLLTRIQNRVSFGQQFHCELPSFSPVDLHLYIYVIFLFKIAMFLFKSLDNQATKLLLSFGKRVLGRRHVK